MRVVVDKAGDHRAAFDIDHFGVGLRELAYLDIAAGRHHTPVLDRQRLHNGKTIINRDDLAVDDNGVYGVRIERYKKTQ